VKKDIKTQRIVNEEKMGFNSDKRKDIYAALPKITFDDPKKLHRESESKELYVLRYRFI